MRNIILGMSAFALAAVATPALAEEATDGFTVTGGAALVSDYRFRGLSQSGEEAAVQGWATIGHESGFYAGFWGSNVDFGDGESDLETDFYVGYGGSLGENTTFDLNVTYYAYPGTPGSWNYDFMEFAASLKYSFDAGSVGAKAAYSPAFFGDTGDAFYLGGNVTFALVDWLSVSGNVGKQWLDDDTLNYVHYDFGLTATVENVSFDLRWIATDIDGDDDEVVGTISFAF